MVRGKAAERIPTESRALKVVEPEIVESEEVDVAKFFKFERYGLVMMGDPSFEACEKYARVLNVIDSAIQFAVGDFINWTESRFGEMASQLIDEADWSESTVRVYRWVAAKIAPPNRRMDGKLHFSHHQLVADLTPSQQVVWLERAEKGDNEGAEPWSVARLKKELKLAKDGGPSDSEGSSESRPQVIVYCESAADVEALCRQLDNLGRTDYKKKS